MVIKFTPEKNCWPKLLVMTKAYNGNCACYRSTLVNSYSQEGIKADYETTGFACLPYVRGTSDKIRKILRKKNITVRIGSSTQLKNIISTAKDRISNLKNEEVYKISCNCGQCYEGQIGRSAEVTIKKYQRDVQMRKL